MMHERERKRERERERGQAAASEAPRSKALVDKLGNETIADADEEEEEDAHEDT